jgi:ribose/xylose/arabinose/galactoside ABC-type transport system permease subunit
MKTWEKWLSAVAGLAAALVAVSAVVQAVRQGSWSPLIAVGWLLAVVAATLPGASRRCLPRRRNGQVNHPAG